MQGDQDQSRNQKIKAVIKESEDQSCWHLSDQLACLLACLLAWSHLQSLPLVVEQLGDVPGDPLHQVLGVVPLDFELTLLFVINLRAAEKTESHIGSIRGATAEQKQAAIIPTNAAPRVPRAGQHLLSFNPPQKR